jgi:CBS domain containing-hemolysin-like protein
MLLLISISLGGILLACMCIFSLPDKSTLPITGSFYYLFSSFTLIAYFIIEWRRLKSIETELTKNANQVIMKIIAKESFAAQIFKWIVTIFAILFSFLSAGIALICLYALPNGTVQPSASILFLFSGLIIMGTLVIIAWKNPTTP